MTLHPGSALAAAALALGLGCGGGQRREAAHGESAASQQPAAAPQHVEPAPENDVQIEGQMGTVEQSDVEAIIGRQQRAVMDCYTQAATGKRWLGGALEVKVRVAKDGSVKTIAPSTPLGAIAVERCVVGVVRQLKFPTPRGGPEAEFNYAWQFRAAAPLAEWEADAVAPVFAKHRKDIDGCSRAASAPPALRVALFVLPGGKVGAVGVGADGTVEDAYADCVATKVAAWKFADPRGKVARAVYQF